MPSAHKVLAGLCGAALVATIALGLLRSSTLVYSLGVAPAVPVAGLRPGQQACQGAVIVPNGTAFDRVRIALGTYRRPGPEVEVVVRRAASRVPIARGRLAGGYGDFADAPWHVVPVKRVSTATPLSICIVNRGKRPVAPIGNAPLASRTSSASVGGVAVPGDISLKLERSPRSLLATIPESFERASLFKAGFVGAWTFWLLTPLVLLGVPALLVAALRAAEPDDERAPSAGAAAPGAE